ncbi:DUF1681-domain-containing protein [Hortaea werneckii]|uniref:NECAP PHear domain-containing protein n=1 Tax=Hortaea werneckii TaxID=91943 RepID=A0A3M7F3L9_HORWE|nr:DUF1681-domain-containing protein [Hortaea werneckii]KAI6992875.1 DUF1681-domain-containing protein [Hortaea werneckii]KAI7140942.1 DUF1681-domain-containing protein [Hortaea werneckii]KAI7167966.1 DUF1681-domain-containing protein [Hortaea werneckii]KAI7183866.1 DUF1681-domain-containing protein [Hortaea werneckii]
MAIIDPATGRPLQESDASFQRVLFVTNGVHVYGIPPITSTKGFNASSWTSPTQPTAQEIFTARVRIVETTVDSKVKVDIALEDGNTGDLFAAAPYTSVAVVQQASDSSRFFAVRVQGEGGMKATLGIGFEDRGPAFDFSVALREAGKILGMNDSSAAQSGRSSQANSKAEGESKQDFSLKEGEKIHIQVGQKGRRAPSPQTAGTSDSSALFSIAPPPDAGKGSEAFPSIAPPPSSKDTQKSAQELGFDDGEFGEFQ